jgi:hypothetical protein
LLQTWLRRKFFVKLIIDHVDIHLACDTRSNLKNTESFDFTRTNKNLQTGKDVLRLIIKTDGLNWEQKILDKTFKIIVVKNSLLFFDLDKVSSEPEPGSIRNQKKSVKPEPGSIRNQNKMIEPEPRSNRILLKSVEPACTGTGTVPAPNPWIRLDSVWAYGM